MYHVCIFHLNITIFCFPEIVKKQKNQELQRLFSTVKLCKQPFNLKQYLSFFSSSNMFVRLFEGIVFSKPVGRQKNLKLSADVW